MDSTEKVLAQVEKYFQENGLSKSEEADGQRKEASKKANPVQRDNNRDNNRDKVSQSSQKVTTKEESGNKSSQEPVADKKQPWEMTREEHRPAYIKQRYATRKAREEGVSLTANDTKVLAALKDGNYQSIDELSKTTGLSNDEVAVS